MVFLSLVPQSYFPAKASRSNGNEYTRDAQRPAPRYCGTIRGGYTLVRLLLLTIVLYIYVGKT